MIIRSRNTFCDIIAFCFYHYPRSPAVVISYGIAFAMFSFVIFQSLPNNAGITAKIIIFLMMEAVAFVILVMVFGFFTVISMISSRNKTLFTERTISLGEDGFISETPHSRSEMKWSIVQKLARTRSYIYIYVTQHSAHVVPRRAFQDAGEWDSFYEFCKRKSRVV